MNVALPWNKDASNIPFNEPILIKQKTYDIPFMIIRVIEFEMDRVNLLMGPNLTGYGFEIDLNEIEAWLIV